MRRSEDSIRVLVAGASFGTWLSAEMDSDIFTEADAWRVTASEPSEDLVGVFREGQRVEMYVGSDRQLAGVIDDVRLHGDRSRTTLALSGRDLGAFLLDSETAKIRASKYTLLTLAQKLVDPTWGVRNVLTSFERDRKLALGKRDRTTRAGTSKRPPLFGDAPRATSAVDPGQKVAAVLNERTRQLGCAWWLTAGGDLFIGKPNYEQEPAFAFEVGPRRRDVEEWEVVRQMSDRYSKITVVGQGSSAAGFNTNPSSVTAAKFKATAEDPDLVKRGIKRELILVDNDAQSAADCQRRAESEMGHRRLQGLTIRLTVPGFRQSNRLFSIDTLATVRIPAAGIKGTFYVTQRTFTESRGKLRTALTLHETKVWLP